MSPWVNAAMVVVAVASIVFGHFWATRTNTEPQHSSNQSNCHYCDSAHGCSYHGKSSKPTTSDYNRPCGSSSSGGQERYDTPPDFRSNERSEEDECPICLYPIYTKPQHTLQCKHRIHSECYEELRKQSDSCPVCRQRH